MSDVENVTETASGRKPYASGADQAQALDAALAEAEALRSRWGAMEAAGQEPDKQAALVCARVAGALASVWRPDAAAEGRGDGR